MKIQNTDVKELKVKLIMYSIICGFLGLLLGGTISGHSNS